MCDSRKRGRKTFSDVERASTCRRMAAILGLPYETVLELWDRVRPGPYTPATQSIRAQEWADDRCVWAEFRHKLAAIKTFYEAYELLSHAVPDGVPGWHYYSNLGYFLRAFIAPAGSTYEEKGLYLDFIRRLDATHQLRPGSGKMIEKALLRAIVAQRAWVLRR